MFFFGLSIIVLVVGTVAVHALLMAMLESGKQWVMSLALWVLAMSIAYIPAYLLYLLGFRQVLQKADEVIRTKKQGGEWQKK